MQSNRFIFVSVSIYCHLQTNRAYYIIFIISVSLILLLLYLLFLILTLKQL